MALLMNNVPFPPHYLVYMYIDELEKYMNKIDGDSPRWYGIVVAIILCVDGVVFLSKLGASPTKSF